MKKRNPVLKDLRTPKYRTRIEKSHKEYSRKIKNEKAKDDE